MVYEIKEITQDNLTILLNEIKKRKKKEVFAMQGMDGLEYEESVRNEWRKEILAMHYGSLVRNIDGVKYQKIVRSEWD